MIARKTTIASSVLALVFLALPLSASAAALTTQQSSSLISVVQSSPGTPARAFVNLITAFSNILVSQAESLIGVIQASPGTSATAFIPLLASFTVDSMASVPSAPATQPSASAYVAPSIAGSPYRSSNLGYDISYSTYDYPQPPFGFAVIGVTGGKAFVHNPRLASQFSWATLSSSNAPTIYLNLNAPYGSAATTENVSAPQTCATPFGAPVYSALAGGTYPDPAPCAGYNFGYNTAKDAFEHASSQNTFSPHIWWLDIEEANSWSDTKEVNQQVIQGAIDYLNKQNIRVGIYSVPYMWRMIAGDGFTPKESIGNSGVPVPTWFPIGISNQVSATNACHTRESFIPGSPVWIIQYVLDSVAVDQNVAC